MTNSTTLQTHDWVVYRLGVLFGSVGHKVKIHKITPPTGKERGDIEIKDCVVSLGCSHFHPIEQITQTKRSDGDPDPDGVHKETTRIKIRHYRNIYLNRPDPIVFLSLGVDTSDCLYMMMTSFVCFSCMLIVRYLMILM